MLLRKHTFLAALILVLQAPVMSLSAQQDTTAVRAGQSDTAAGLQPKSSDTEGGELQEVTVRASKVQMVWRGDTLVYDATAFNVAEGSQLDALIGQLPGVELKANGEITVNGRHVDYLMLNGKDFFRGNNRVMLDNLPHYSVQNIQVYEKTTELSEYLGHDYEQKEYVMNVQLKREYNQGYIANAEAALGTDDRWLARAFALRYTDHSRLSLMGNTNNINETRRPGTDGEWTPSNNLRGLLTQKKLNLDLNVDDVQSRWQENGNVLLAWSDQTTEHRKASSNYLSGANAFDREQYGGRTEDFNLEFNNHFTLLKPWRVDVQTQLFWSPKYDLHSELRRATFAADPDSLGSTVALLDTLFGGSALSPLRRIALNTTWLAQDEQFRYLQIYQRIHATKHLSWGDDFFCYAAAFYRRAATESLQQQHYDYYREQQPNDHRLISNPQDSRSLQLDAHAEYIVNLPKGWHALVYYHFMRSNEKEEKPYWSLDPLRPDWFDPYNSVFTHYYNDKHRVGPRFYYHRQDDRRYLWFNVHLPMDWHHERESYLRAPVDTCVRQRIFTFMPDMTFIYQDRERHTFYYLTASRSARTPDIVGRVGYRDAMNPLSVTIGNPSLKPAYTYHWKMQFRHDRPAHEQVLNLSLVGEVTHNAITQATAYRAETGSYTTQLQNISGHWNTELSADFQRTLDTLRHWRVEQSLSLSFRRAPGRTATSEHIVSGLLLAETMRLSTFRLGEQFALRYRLNDRFDVRPTFSLVYNHTRSDLPTFRTRSIYDISCGLTLHWTLPLHIQLATDLGLFSNRGSDDAQMNSDNLVWNAQLTRSFCRGSLVLKLTAFDLLGQLTDIHHSYSDVGTASTWTRCLNRYALLSLMWKLNKAPRGAAH